MSETSKFYKKTILISLAIFVVVSVLFFYLEGFFIQKIDERMGITKEITVLDITKSYDSTQGTEKITVSYTTLKKSTSYIKIEDVRSESSYGKNFSKTLIMDKAYAGKNVNVTIVSIDDNNNEAILLKSVILPKNVESTIRITG